MQYARHNMDILKPLFQIYQAFIVSSNKRLVKDRTHQRDTYKVDFQRFFAWTHFNGKGLCLQMSLLFEECIIFGVNRDSKVSLCGSERAQLSQR